MRHDQARHELIAFEGSNEQDVILSGISRIFITRDSRRAPLRIGLSREYVLNKMNDALPTLNFWFDFGSNYSYLSVMRIEELARQAGGRLVWRPFSLGTICRDFGWQTSPLVLQAEKGRYTWNDMRRRAAQYRLEFNMPSVFPRSAILPMRVALLASDQPWIGSFCKRVMLQNFVEDLDINHADNTRQALDGLAPDPDAFVQAAQSDEVEARLREQTSEARALGIFRAPTFFIGDEMFWGDDRRRSRARVCAPSRFLQCLSRLICRIAPRKGIQT